jgi:type IV pilus assembly protein PilX
MSEQRIMFNRPAQPRFPRRARERGVVLFVALVFLILLTLLAIGASSGSLLQQRMVAATRSAQLATMSGDSALRGAEWRIWSTSSAVGGNLICDSSAVNTSTGCVKYDPTSTLYASGGTVTEFRTADNSWLSLTGPITYKGPGGSGFTSGLATANIAENPQYLIEDMGLVKPPGSGPQHESGVTGPNNGGAGHLNIHIFRITARATGGTKNTVRVVQSTFDAQATN